MDRPNQGDQLARLRRPEPVRVGRLSERPGPEPAPNRPRFLSGVSATGQHLNTMLRMAWIPVLAIALGACEPLGAESRVEPRVEPEPTEPIAVPSRPPLRVFFVGNSHTYYNDMPAMVAALATEAARSDASVRPFEFAMEAPGGANLVAHLATGQIAKRLSGARWDYVVLQEQQQRPSFRFNPKQLDDEFYGPARTLDIVIKATGAKTLLYMTAARLTGDPDNVPNDTYEAMQERVRESYVALGSELGADVVPVGTAFRNVHAQHPNIPLWDQDRSHPGRHGSYLAACVFFNALYGKSPEGNAYLGGLPETDARILQAAAQSSLSATTKAAR